jgi:hypothetical protein
MIARSAASAIGVPCFQAVCGKNATPVVLVTIGKQRAHKKGNGRAKDIENMGGKASSLKTIHYEPRIAQSA